VLDGHVALDRPADAERDLTRRQALDERAQRVDRDGAGGDGVVRRGACRWLAERHGELLRQRAQRGDELVRCAGRGFVEARAEVVEVDLGLRVHREADPDRLGVDAQREERVAPERARVVDGLRDGSAAVEQALELLSRGRVTREEHPLRVDPLLVAERRVLVGAVEVDGDAEGAEAAHDRSRPAERALLHLQPRARERVGGGLLGRVGVEVARGEVERGVAHGDPPKAARGAEREAAVSGARTAPAGRAKAAHPNVVPRESNGALDPARCHVTLTPLAAPPEEARGHGRASRRTDRLRRLRRVLRLQRGRSGRLRGERPHGAQALQGLPSRPEGARSDGRRAGLLRARGRRGLRSPHARRTPSLHGRRERVPEPHAGRPVGGVAPRRRPHGLDRRPRRPPRDERAPRAHAGSRRTARDAAARCPEASWRRAASPGWTPSRPSERTWCAERARRAERFPALPGASLVGSPPSAQAARAVAQVRDHLQRVRRSGGGAVPAGRGARGLLRGLLPSSPPARRARGGLTVRASLSPAARGCALRSRRSPRPWAAARRSAARP
jgi:hypothetical protein